MYCYSVVNKLRASCILCAEMQLEHVRDAGSFLREALLRNKTLLIISQTLIINCLVASLIFCLLHKAVLVASLEATKQLITGAIHCEIKCASAFRQLYSGIRATNVPAA